MCRIFRTLEIIQLGVFRGSILRRQRALQISSNGQQQLEPLLAWFFEARDFCSTAPSAATLTRRMEESLAVLQESKV